jgi:hypothetical protein
MTYDTTGERTDTQVESEHNRLATEYGRDNVFVFGTEAGDVVALIGENVGERVFDGDIKVKETPADGAERE